MDKHITLAAALNLAFGILGVLVAFMLFVFIVGAGIVSRDPHAIRVTWIVGTAIAFILTLTSVPAIIGGLGLLKRKSWARILLLIVSALQLLDIPLGTALGIYTIWVLIQDETKTMLEPGPPVA
ncbi:MAG: hypothetical protein ABIJ00_00630 [Candidatus Eisenbacteria bacterium]